MTLNCAKILGGELPGGGICFASRRKIPRTVERKVHAGGPQGGRFAKFQFPARQVCGLTSIRLPLPSGDVPVFAEEEMRLLLAWGQ